MRTAALTLLIAFNAWVLIYALSGSREAASQVDPAPELVAQDTAKDESEKLIAVANTPIVLAQAVESGRAIATAAPQSPFRPAWREPVDGKEFKEVMPPIAESRETFGSGGNRLLPNTEFGPEKPAQKKLGVQSDPNPRNLDLPVVSAETP